MRLLVVDDDTDIRNFLKKALESECYIVDSADNGREGSFLARTNDYDVIILDVNLPEKDGFSVCRDIRRDGNMTPILILSVRSEIPTKVELLESGADDYLTKPFSFQELVARIKALTRRPQKIDNEIITIGSLIINMPKNEVAFQGKEILLTRKEYILLEYLAQNRDRVISRGDLMEHVWDMNADPFSNTIEVHVRNLRKKLGLKDKSSLIRTVSGRGYMLNSKDAQELF